MVEYTQEVNIMSIALESIGYTGKKAEKLISKNILTGDALLCSSPNKYWYFDQTYPLEFTEELKNKIEEGIPIAIIGTVKLVDNEYKRDKNISLIKVRVEDEVSRKILFVNFLGNYHMLEYYKSCVDRKVIVGGKLQYNPQFSSFSMLNPVVFSKEIEKYKRIIPVYKKYKGISEDYYRKSITEAFSLITEDCLPLDMISKMSILTYKEALRALHFPLSADAIKRAKQRLIFDDLLYFALMLEDKRQTSTGTSKYKIISTEIMSKLISELPYELTEGQDIAIKDMINTSRRGEKISSLVQGDVGTGKTIVAVSLMVAMAENGYQTVLMAPTTVLAEQHYGLIKALANKYGITSTLLTNNLKEKEKRDILEQIKEGNVSLIIGTHSVISESVEYANLGLVITDEEHKFGVVQREKLSAKAASDVHKITMSGTPIPRTLANTLYGDSVKVYSLKRPAERKPIQTAICSSDKAIFDWINKEVTNRHQIYVVCPLIEEAEEDSKVVGIASIEETYDKYNKHFAPLGIKCGVITGKTSAEDKTKIMEAYNRNEIQILIATTVIEVGVNNPNATVIVITGAERFGLATLHQLRGRVGRGKDKSYCILQKTPGYEGGANLEILCRESDGLEIAKADLKQRGMGNIIGLEQSGQNKFVNLMLEYPNMFERIKLLAKSIYGSNIANNYIKDYEDKFGIT